MSYRKTEFNKLNNAFNEAVKAVLDKTDLSTDRLEDILDCYNALISYAEIDYENKKHSTKEYIKSVIGVNRITLQRCYENLKIPITLPGKLLSTIHYLPQQNPPAEPKASIQTSTSDLTLNENISTSTTNLFENKDILTSTSNLTINQDISTSTTDLNKEKRNSTPTKNDSPNKTDSKTNSQSKSQTTSNENTHTNTNSSSNKNSEMDEAQFIKTCGAQINKDFSGDPLSLKSFINSINLLKRVGANNLETLRLFVLTKITGKAQECIRENPATVDEIIEDLKKYIKPDNSKVIEGRMQALRFNVARAQEFTQQAEELAEALQRTLIIEGVSQQKAKEMTIERTIDMCRQTARTEFVRSIIASASFETPKDVLAKFVVENSKEKTEKQILAVRQSNNNRNTSNNFQNRNSNGRGRGNFRGNRQNYNNNYRNQNNSYGNNSRNYRGNNRNGRYQRGRNNYNNYNNNNNDRYVRVMSENYSSPPNGRAETQNVATNQPTILRLASNNQ